MRCSTGGAAWWRRPSPARRVTSIHSPPPASTSSRRFPSQTIEEGDVLITNDPWLSAGHFFDITVMVPAFYKGKLVGFFGSTIHHTDIGGYGVGAGARDVHEEGLWIPMLKLYERGEPNKVLHEIIRRNVRTPNEVFGDLAAQVSSGKLAAKRLSALLDRQCYDDIETALGRDHRAVRSRDARVDPQAQGRYLSRREPVRRAGRRHHRAEDRRDGRRRTKARSPSTSRARRARAPTASMW